VKNRILYRHATEVLHLMAETWKGRCETYVLSVVHLNELKITDKGNCKTQQPSVERACVLEHNEKTGTSDWSAIVVGFLA
jgi:hypothetical protein